ncbi:MAG: nucleoside kinase [Ruminococcus sp.]|nr:nucleoside kinase [Ruminococcus sp.]
MKKVNINLINRKLLDQKLFVDECNEKYERRLKTCAEKIADGHNERPIVLLSGPSGSGKTTSALKIDNMLDEMGLFTHTISLDDYFLPKGEFEHMIDDNGKPDYESPLRLDIKKLNDHMMKIHDCEEIMIPKFNFAEQSTSDGFLFKRGKDDIIVFEGIHALNPQITGPATEYARCMYVSVRSRVELTDGKLVHPKFIRLMRRLIRDELYRGRRPADTLDMFDSVQRGEDKYIQPYKHLADNDSQLSIDTFLAYEPSVYKDLLIGKMEQESETYEGFDKFEPLLDLLEEAEPIDLGVVGSDSLVREFIGGSCYFE